MSTTPPSDPTGDTDPTRPDDPPGARPAPEAAAPDRDAGHAPRRLTRSATDRVFGGIAGGLGRYFDVDPVVFRIGFAAATLVGGIGLVAYLAALLFVPDEGAEQSPAARSRLLTIGGAIALAIAAIASLDNGGVFFEPVIPIVIVGGIGYGIFRAVRGSGDGRPLTFGRVAGWVALGAGALLAAFALAFGSAWATAEGAGVVVAAVVIGIGVLLVVSGLRPGGRATWWLVAPALIMAVPLGIVSAADVSLDGGIGDRTYRPASVDDLPAGGYRLGAGELVVDLRDVDLPPNRETVLDVAIGMGSAEVLVPADVCATTRTRVGGGYVNLRGRDAGGVDMRFTARAEDTGAPRLLVRGDVGLGALEIVDQPYDRFEGPRGFDRDGDGLDFGDTPVQDGGCTDVMIASAG